jgi:hypothetical protein
MRTASKGEVEKQGCSQSLPGQKMKIRFRTEIDQFFTQAKPGGAIWGRVCFELSDGQFFPDQGWTDLVIAVERIWLETVLAFAERETSSDEVPFYDGPFRVELTAADNGIVNLRFLRYGDVCHTSTADIRELLRDALTVGVQLASSCAERRWSNEDTGELALLIDRATSYIERNRKV